MKLLKEPLVHFLVLAMLLFVLEQVFSATQKEKIIVDEQTAGYLVKQREDLELRKLSAGERRETIDSYIEDEILYSEAYKRGLDKGDSRMRRNMILKMRGLLIGDLKDPSDEQLRAYFEANRDQFTRAATLSFEHVVYNDPAQVPEDLLEQLRAGADHTTLGDDGIRLGRTVKNMSESYLGATLGADATRAILAIDDARWQGPFESTYGVHYVKIIERTPATPARYEDVKSYIDGYWQVAESRKLIEEEIERLQQNYEVIVEGEGEAAP